MEAAVEYGLYALVFVAALAYFFRYKRRQRNEDDRDDLRSFVLRTDRSPDDARRGVRRYARRARGVTEAEDSGDPLVLVSAPSPLQPGYYFRVRVRSEDGGSQLDVGVRSRMPLYLWHPFVDGKVEDVADGLVEELDPAVRLS